MTSTLSLLGKYTDTFRALINRAVRSDRRAIKDALRLNGETEWYFLTAAIDIIDDASAAIENVQRFGLTGPTKYGEIGETYLRLHGLLGAAYAQQSSILTLYNIMKVPNVKEQRNRFRDLEMVTLRHKLSAHGVNHLSKSGTLEAFVPVRMFLSERKVSYSNYTRQSRQEHVDIFNALSAHVEAMIETMDQILEKAIKTVFKHHTNKRLEFEAKLADLREERSGTMMVVGMAGTGAKLKIVVMGK
jgi:hypothetical protein